jgi:opacity protein-like surface antigen
MHTESSFEGRDLTTKTTLDIEKDCNKIDLSIPVGISYEFRSHFVIDARYNIGLTKVNKESVSGVKDYKNNVVSLTVGYKFAL